LSINSSYYNDLMMMKTEVGNDAENSALIKGIIKLYLVSRRYLF